jgi:hypothetical protein
MFSYDYGCLFMRNYFSETIEMTKWNYNVLSDDENIAADERVKENRSQCGTEVSEKFEHCNGQIKSQQQCETVYGTANQLILVILADEGIQLFYQEVVVVHFI